MNFSLGELEDLFLQMQEILNQFETFRYDERMYKIYLGNGDIINYQIPKSSIAHLLGVKIDKLQATSLFKSTDSISLLKELCENPYRIYTSANKGIISYDSIFSQFIKAKVDYFFNNIKINIYDTLFVVKYSKERIYYMGENGENYDYIIVKEDQNKRIGILCLKNNGDFYVPMSNQVFINFESAKEAIKKLVLNQDITIISGCSILNEYDEFNKPINLRLDIKHKKVQLLGQISKEFNAHTDILKDYIHYLGKAIGNLNDRAENENLIPSIVKRMKEGKAINQTMYENTEFFQIVQAYNDSLHEELSKSTGKKYSELISELKELKEQLAILKKEHETLSTQFFELQVQNEQTNEKNKVLNQKLNAIVRIIGPES